MSDQPYIDAYVIAVAITRGESFLTLFNERWGGFTLPMSKMRTWPDPDRPSVMIEEDPQVTAIRVVVEAIGRPLKPHEMPQRHAVQTLDPYKPSLRDGIWKLFHYGIFQLELAPDETLKPLGDVPMAWMTLDEMRELKPVSETAIMIAQAMKAETTRTNSL